MIVFYYFFDFLYIFIKKILQKWLHFSNNKRKIIKTRMLYSSAIYEVCILLLGSLVAFLVCRPLKINLFLGYLGLGMVLGPSGLGILKGSSLMHYFGELGVLFFLFAVGLEVPWHRLLALRYYIFGLGACQVITSSLALWGLGALGIQPTGVAFLMSLALSFSSTAVILQLLAERFELTTLVGRVSLSILLFQDLVAVALFASLGVLSGPYTQGAWGTLGWLALGVVLTVPVLKILAFVVEKLFRLYQKGDFVLPCIVLMVIGMGLWGEYWGLSAEAGPFVLGMMLAGTPWRHQMAGEIHSLRTFFMATFFMAVGLQVDLAMCLKFLPTILKGWALLTGVKWVLMLGISFIWRLSWTSGVQIACLLSGTSEFLLIFLGQEYIQKLLGPQYVQIFLGINFLSMSATPLAFWGVRFLLDLIKRKWSFQGTRESLQEKHDIIIAGFGHVGQTVARILEHNLLSFLVVDYDVLRVEKARKQGYAALQGDARDLEFLKKIGIAHAKLFLLTYGHQKACVELVRTVGKKFPHVYTCVQVQNHQQAILFAGLGAHIIIPQAVEAGIQMAATGLECLGFSPEHAQQMTCLSQSSLPGALGGTHAN